MPAEKVSGGRRKPGSFNPTVRLDPTQVRYVPPFNYVKPPNVMYEGPKNVGRLPGGVRPPVKRQQKKR